MQKPRDWPPNCASRRGACAHNRLGGEEIYDCLFYDWLDYCDSHCLTVSGRIVPVQRARNYLWAIASADAHGHAITGSDERGVQTIKNGHLFQDGRIGDLVSGERRVLERRGDVPARVELHALDEHGRELHAEGEVSSVLRWTGWPGRLAYWTLDALALGLSFGLGGKPRVLSAGCGSFAAALSWVVGVGVARNGCDS